MAWRLDVVTRNDVPRPGVRPHDVLDRAMDSMPASAIYLLAWWVPGFSAGEAFGHWWPSFVEDTQRFGHAMVRMDADFLMCTP